MDTTGPVEMTNLGNLSDAELVARVRDGRDPAAFELLVHAHRRRVRFLVSAKLPRERWEELEQDVFLAAFETILSGAEIEHFGAWLAQLTRHKLADFWRGREGRRLLQDRAAAAREDDELGPREEARDGDFGLFEVGELVEQVLASRSPQHRAVVEGAVFRQDPATQVARDTGVSAANVYKVVQRFRDDLRVLLHPDEPGQEHQR